MAEKTFIVPSDEYAQFQQPRPLGFGLFGGKKTDLQPTEHYRKTTLGQTFQETLEELVAMGKLPEHAIEKAMSHFDVHMFGHLSKATPRIQMCITDVTVNKEIGKAYTWLVENAEIQITGTDHINDSIIIPGIEKMRIEMFPAAAVKKRYSKGVSLVIDMSKKNKDEDPLAEDQEME